MFPGINELAPEVALKLIRLRIDYFYNLAKKADYRLRQTHDRDVLLRELTLEFIDSTVEARMMLYAYQITLEYSKRFEK